MRTRLPPPSSISETEARLCSSCIVAGTSFMCMWLIWKMICMWRGSRSFISPTGQASSASGSSVWLV